MSAKIQKFQQCQSFIRYHSKFKLRCQLPARHPKWHKAVQCLTWKKGEKL